MATGIDLRCERRLVGLQRRQLALRQAHVDCVGQSAVEAPLSEINIAARGINILTEHCELPLLSTHVEIETANVGGYRHERPIVGVLEGVGICRLGLYFPAEFA